MEQVHRTQLLHNLAQFHTAVSLLMGRQGMVEPRVLQVRNEANISQSEYVFAAVVIGTWV